MIKKVKKVLKKTIKFVCVICTILVGILIVCGLPLEEIKDKIKKKIEKEN